MPASDDEVEKLVKCFELLNKVERTAVIRLVTAMSERAQRTGKPAVSRGYSRCEVCGEHDVCYSRRGVSRCAKCRRESAMKGE